MIRRPLCLQRTDYLCPYPTSFRAAAGARGGRLMGYLPPAPPPEWIEVTTLVSEEREFVAGNEGGRAVDRSLQRAEIAHRANMETVHAQTMREARIGTRSEEQTSELQSLMRISYAVF